MWQRQHRNIVLRPADHTLQPLGPEARQVLGARQLSGGHLVQARLHPRREVRARHLRHLPRQVGGHQQSGGAQGQLAALKPGIVTGLQRLEGLGVGAGPPDPGLLHRLYQRGLSEARRGTGLLAFGRLGAQGHRLPLGQGRQPLVVLLVVVALEQRGETRLLQHPALRLEGGGPAAEHHHGPGIHRVVHLAGHGPLVDQGIERQFVSREPHALR